MEAIYEKILPGGHMWSQVISRGKTLRLTDVQGGANVGMLLYNADNLSERYNMPDTLKGQHIFYLRKPFCLHSDMGRVFASITGDSVGWHDTVCGSSDAQSVAAKYGTKTYQEARNEWYRNGKENFLIELAKWGLGKKDLLPNLNWFSKVVADEGGRLSFVSGHSGPGDHVDLRLEMNSLVVLHTCAHPFDPRPEYGPGPVGLTVWPSGEVAPEDASRLSRPQNERAFRNTEDYYALRA
ncbi:MAG: urea amidolyase associated protein UAAP1 [Verrucomicrobiota bacterium]